MTKPGLHLIVDSLSCRKQQYCGARMPCKRLGQAVVVVESNHCGCCAWIIGTNEVGETDRKRPGQVICRHENLMPIEPDVVQQAHAETAE